MKLFSNIWNSFSYIRRSVPNIRKWFSNITEYRFLSTKVCHIICFVSFCFVSFRFVSFRFDLFRFVSICFVSFRSVSFRSVSFLFRFALYRDPRENNCAPSPTFRHWATPLMVMHFVLILSKYCRSKIFLSSYFTNISRDGLEAEITTDLILRVTSLRIFYPVHVNSLW